MLQPCFSRILLQINAACEKETKMSLSLDLPTEFEKQLANEAQQHGLSLHDYVLQKLGVQNNIQNIPKTGADLVAYWKRENLLGTHTHITDSVAHARNLRMQAEKRSQK